MMILKYNVKVDVIELYVVEIYTVSENSYCLTKFWSMMICVYKHGFLQLHILVML